MNRKNQDGFILSKQACSRLVAIKGRIEAISWPYIWRRNRGRIQGVSWPYEDWRPYRDRVVVVSWCNRGRLEANANILFPKATAGYI